MSLNDREKYCIGLILLGGGEAEYDEIRNIVLETHGSFEGLKESYIRKGAVINTLRGLVKKNYLSEKEYKFSINSVFEPGFIQRYPTEVLGAIRSELAYRKKHMLEFDTFEIEDFLLNPKYYDKPPFELLTHLHEALELQRNISFDSVLVQCGKCVELMLLELNEDYGLFDKKLTIGHMIRQLQDDQIIRKINAQKDDLRTFADGVGLVYRFRNIMGAHASGTFEWGLDQVATSCLILTLYLADLYSTKIRGKRKP